MTELRTIPKSLLRWGERLVWLALLVWVGIRVAPQASAWTGLAGAGEPAPQIHVETWEGGAIAEEDVRGQVVVLSFWATWCLPCRLEMPTLQRLHERYADEGLLVLGLVMDGHDRKTVDEFLAQFGITFAIAAPSSGIRTELGGIDRLPTTLLIDRKGRIRYRVVGLFAPSALTAGVRRLLGES